MLQIDHVNYNTKRVYLHQDTMLNGFDIILAHFEVKKQAAANIANGQFRYPPTEAIGNVQKTTAGAKPASFSPRYGWTEPGWRFVPYAGASHILSLNCEIVSKDQLKDSDVFDFSGLAVNVHIISDYEAIEIREVVVGGPLTTEQDNKLMSLPTATETAVETLTYNSSCP